MLRPYKHTGTRGKQRKSKQPQPTRNKPPPDIDNEGNAPTYGEEKTAPAPFFCPCAVFALYGATFVRPAAYRAAGGKRPDVWRRGGRPALFFYPVCSVRPFVGRITRPLFVQWEAKARKPQQYTTRRTRGRKYSRHPPKGGDLTHSYKKSVSRRGRY